MTCFPFNPKFTPRFFHNLKSGTMKVSFFAIILAVFAAFAIAPKETKTTNTLPPEDTLLKTANYQNAQFAIYAKGGEAVVDSKMFKVEGEGYLNALFETEIVDSAGNYIVIDTLGVTRYRFDNLSGVFLPAQNDLKK